jgi:septal ring factor EnvC (AmiA/AmiB activator)
MRGFARRLRRDGHYPRAVLGGAAYTISYMGYTPSDVPRNANKIAAVDKKITEEANIISKTEQKIQALEREKTALEKIISKAQDKVQGFEKDKSKLEAEQREILESLQAASGKGEKKK